MIFNHIYVYLTITIIPQKKVLKIKERVFLSNSVSWISTYIDLNVIMNLVD